MAIFVVNSFVDQINGQGWVSIKYEGSLNVC